MESYSCKGKLLRTRGQAVDEYEIQQDYKISGEYKLTLISPERLKGNYTLFDGEKIYQYNPKISPSVVTDIPESSHRNELFLGNFIKNYFKSEETAIASASLDDASCTILEAVIPGENPALATEKLWINNESLEPLRLVIYNNEGKEQFDLTYTEFEYNTQFEDGFFKP